MRDPDLLQSTDFPPNNPFPSDAVERAFDKLTMIAQAISANEGRTVHFPLSETVDGELPLSGDRANKMYGFDANGVPTVLPMPSSIGAGDLRWEKGVDGTRGFKTGADFTPGVTAQLTLSRSPVSDANVWVYWDGVPQTDFSISNGNQLNFPTAIPDGISVVDVRVGTTLSLNIPAQQSVGADQLVDGAITDSKIDVGSALSNRLHHSIDVTDPAFGAVGNWNGATGNDDTTAIQAGINALSAAGGGILLFPAGKNFKVSAALTLASNICFYGPGATITQTANNTQIFNGTGLSNVRFDSLTFQGVGYADTAPTDTGHLFSGAFATAIFITNSNGVYITRCRFNQFLNAGVITAYTSNLYITENTISGTFQGTGDTKTPPADGSFAAFGIYNFAGNTNISVGIGGIHICDNTISTTCHGIFCGPGYANVNISGNHISNCAQHGLYLNPGSKLTVTNNAVSQTYGDGIKVQSTNVATYFNPDGIVVANNACTNSPNGVWGIIVDCITSSGDTTTTIYHQAVVVANNAVYNFGTGGIYVGHARQAKISGNDVSSVAGVGIQAVSFAGSIENNSVSAVFGAAITASPETYQTITARGNRVNGAQLSPGGGSDISFSICSVYAWTTNTFYATNNYATNGGNVYQVTSPGTSAAGPSGTGSAIADGTVTWKYLGATGSIDWGSVYLLDNHVVPHALDIASHSLFIGAGGLKLFWKDNVFPILSAGGVALLVDIANATSLGEDNNVFGGYVANPAAAGPLPGHTFRQFTGSAAPTTGSYEQGDIVWSVAPAAATAIGWVCTASGTPGTWKTFGTIAA
ncbi:MAG TPA: right-handed parallel beta-helix repeat-containing protein [Trinickia sp.]|uniref:right-handed parallel beta-helix repeat-containing protein n=1 Tax=Trinickia sp. TaxID=2571163 RepID=UPI002B879313|nr:right-handed parallel beta-helix repeat-containing protein [Trinickia sp.]HVW50819.1 right-handed parallel beta-helix repeat-containing protein [Trinickia sp.]